MRETRGSSPISLLLLLVVSATLVGLSTCQRQVVDAQQQAAYNSGPRYYYEPQQIQSSESRQQQSESVEYYDDEYYDDEAAEEGEVAPAKPVAPVAEVVVSSREPKTDKESSSNATQQQQQQLYEEDSYYYDDDYEEPKGEEHQHEQQQQEDEKASTAASDTSSSNSSPAPIEASSSEEPEEPINPPLGHDEKPEEQPSSSAASFSPESTPEEKVEEPKKNEESILIGEAIVSVVTTKSVVNGTFSVPDTTTLLPPTTTMEKEVVVESTLSPSTSTSTSSSTTTTTAAPETTSSTTTEFTPSSTIQASVQTGRSVSGARFLPFPSVQDKPEQLDSTESIIDKLDRVQSELSSGFLANSRFVPRRYNKKPFSITSLTLPTTSTTLAPTSPAIAPEPITSTTKRPRIQTTLEDVSAFLPKDFPKSGGYRTSTTAAPLTKRPKIQTTLDDVEAFLPKDFPKGGSYRTSTAAPSTKRPKIQTTLDDVEGFLPKDFPKSGYRGGFKRPSYKTSTTASTSTTTTTQTVAASSTEKSTASTAKKALTTIEDISAFLPPGYKLKKEDATTEKSVVLSEILAKTKLTESKEASAVSPSTTERSKTIPIQDLFAKSAVDISALLPPGYKPDANSPKSSTTAKPAIIPIEDLLVKSAVDVSALLPPGFKPDSSSDSSDPVKDLLAKSKVDMSALLPPGFGKNDATQQSTTTAKSNDGSFKLVFPSRPGGRKPISGHKLTTPSSVRGGGETPAPKIQKGWPTRATTEFTGWPTSSTTPISIEKLLEAARTATVSSLNASVVPTTSEISSTSSTTTTTTTTVRPTTPGICDEECEVAGTIKIVENATWVPELLDRNTREWQDLAEEIEREMNLVFAKSPVLRKWFRNIRIDSFSQGSVLVDYFVELADLKERINTQQLKVIFHDSLRTFDFDNPMEASPKGPMKLGKFIIDPKSTDFVVIPRAAAPKMLEDENRLIPQWAIAVIVIGVGGLLFIIVFGVSVLVNRQHGSKLKPSITAMYEEEVSKNVMSHAAPPSRPASEYQKNDSQTMWNDPGWHDKPFESTSHKILVDGLPYERKYNPYDSWKSEWNGYYYPPTQASGSNYSRHRPDYDINF
ncbi:mucin-5AC [Nasonia vitripennis]|uniref:SEA domain-containing protein n=1 Tax=Nasonia vitripennis TaxID=7425 RepID=A0A7M7PY55_NASVI|nr:mucin-5AC [Nasonia vitripennis]